MIFFYKRILKFYIVRENKLPTIIW